MTMPSLPSNDASVELAKTLEWIREGADRVGGWALEQAPLLAQEFIRWEIWGNLIPTLIFLFICIVGILVTRSGVRYLADERSNADQFMPRLFAGVVLVIVGFINVMIYSGPALKAYVAPRVVIVEKIGELMK